MAMIDERQQHQTLSNLDSFYDLPMKLRPPRPPQLRTVSIMDTLSEMAAANTSATPANGGGTPVGPSTTGSTPWAVDVGGGGDGVGRVKDPGGGNLHSSHAEADDDFLASLFPKSLVSAAPAPSVVSEPPIHNRHQRRMYAANASSSGATSRRTRLFAANSSSASGVGGSVAASGASARNKSVGSSSVIGAAGTSISAATMAGERRRTPEWIRRVFEHARKGDIRALGRELDGLPPALIRSLRDSAGNCLCHVACMRDHLPLLQWLIEVHLQATALLDANKEGATPVQLAIKLGHLSSIKWLLENAETRDLLLLSSKSKSLGNRTLLHLSSKYGQGGLVQTVGLMMKQRGLDLDVRDSRGDTALHLACKKGHLSAVQALLKLGADASASNDRGQTALDLSLRSGQRVCRDYLTLYLASLSVCRDMVQLQTQDRLMRETADQAVQVSKEVVTAGRRLQADRDDLFAQLRTLHDHVASLHERMIVQLRLLLQENSSLRARVNNGHCGGKDNRQSEEEVERSIEMCESLLDDWRKEDELWTLRSPNWRELLKKLQLAEENLDSLGNSSPFPTSSASKSANMKSTSASVSHIRGKSSPSSSSSPLLSGLNTSVTGHHQRISSGAFAVTPDELLRSQMNHVERKYGSLSLMGRDKRKLHPSMDFDFSSPTVTPGSASINRMSASVAGKNSGDDQFFIPPGFEDSLSDSSDSLQQELRDDPSPSRIIRAAERRFDASASAATASRVAGEMKASAKSEKQQRRSDVEAAANAVDELDALLGPDSKKFLMREFLRHQLGRGVGVESEDDVDDALRGGADDDDGENARSRAAGYWTDGIYASTPLKRNSRARRDMDFLGRSWTSDLEDESAVFTSTLGLKKKSASRNRSGGVVSYALGNERISLLANNRTPLSVAVPQHKSHRSAGGGGKGDTVWSVSKSSGHLHLAATAAGPSSPTTGSLMTSTPNSSRTLGRPVSSGSRNKSAGAGVSGAAGTLARRTADLSEFQRDASASSVLHPPTSAPPPLPSSSPPPPPPPAAMQSASDMGGGFDVFDGRSNSQLQHHFRQLTMVGATSNQQHGHHQGHHHRSPRDDVNAKLKAMNLMSKSSNCSVLEVIEPSSTGASDTENNNFLGSGGDGDGDGDGDVAEVNEPEYENAVAAVMQNARGIMIEPQGRMPPPVPPPTARHFHHQPQQRLDGFSDYSEIDVVRGQAQLHAHQQQSSRSFDQTRLVQQKLVVGSGEVCGTLAVEDYYQTVPSPVGNSSSSGKIRSLVDRFETRLNTSGGLMSCEPDVVVGTRPSPMQPTPSPNAGGSELVGQNSASHNRSGSRPSTMGTVTESENESHTRPPSAKSHQVSEDAGSSGNEELGLAADSRSHLSQACSSAGPSSLVGCQEQQLLPVELAQAGSPSAGSSAKKKGFLQKLNLKARWPAKRNKEKSSKRELSPEEFRDTYGSGRRSSGDRHSPASPDRRRRQNHLQELQTDSEDPHDGGSLNASHARASSSIGAQSSSVSSADTGVLKAVQAKHQRQQSEPALVSDASSSKQDGSMVDEQQCGYHQQSLDGSRTSLPAKPSETVLTLGQTCVQEDEDMSKDVRDLDFPGDKGSCEVNSVVGLTLDRPDLTADAACASNGREKKDPLASLASKSRSAPGLPRMSLLTKSSPDLKVQLPSDLTSVGTSEDSGVGIGFHRPGSSASKSDSLSRPGSTSSGPGFSFPLRKASSVSVSTDVLPPGAACVGGGGVDRDASGSGGSSGSAGGPDYGSSSGRMSPAPSATESALSPPSDVSKTESARHLNLHHLGRIGEEVVPAGGVGSGAGSGESGDDRSVSRTGNREEDSASTVNMSVRSERMPSSSERLSDVDASNLRRGRERERERDDDVLVGDIDGGANRSRMSMSNENRDDATSSGASANRQDGKNSAGGPVDGGGMSVACAEDASASGGAVGGEVADGISRKSGVGATKPPIKPKNLKKKTKGEVFKVTIMEDTRPEKKSKAEMKAKRRSERRPWYEEVSDDDGDMLSRGPLSTIVPVRSSSSSESEEDFSADDTESRL